MKISDTTYTTLSALPVTQQVIGFVEVVKATANIAKNIFNLLGTLRAPVQKVRDELELQAKSEIRFKRRNGVTLEMEDIPGADKKINEHVTVLVNNHKAKQRADLRADMKLQAKSLASGIITMIPVVGTVWNARKAYRLCTTA
jgi:hypothetical protein